MKKRSIQLSRNLSPLLKLELEAVLDYSFKGRRIEIPLTYFTIRAAPRKVTLGSWNPNVLIDIWDKDLFSQSFIYDSFQSTIVVLPVLGVGASYGDQITIYNKIGLFISKYLMDWDNMRLENDVNSAILQCEFYNRRLRQNKSLSPESHFFDGQHLAIQKSLLVLEGLRNRLMRYLDDDWRYNYYAPKFENRRFGYKNGKIFFYKGDNKIEMRLGKGIKRLYKIVGREISDEQLKNLVSRIQIEEQPDVLKVVTGTDISKYYKESNYHFDSKLGSLAHSCMRYSKCQPYFKIYEDNAKMLILYNEASRKITGRALLWEATDGTKIMDRIYSTEQNFQLFFAWAKENNYIRKRYQAHNSQTSWVRPDGSGFDRLYNIQLKELPNERSLYDKYPYFDTFYRFDKTNNVIRNRDFSTDSIVDVVSLRGLRGWWN